MKHSCQFLFLLVALLSGWLNACTTDVESSCLTISDTQPNCSSPAAIIFKDLQLKNDTIFRLQDINENQKVVNLVICSQRDYEQYVLVNKGSLPAIDFSQNVLLSGRFIASNRDFVLRQLVTLCESVLHYEVVLERGPGTAITNVYYFAIIPKSSTPKSVAFDVHYQ